MTDVLLRDEGHRSELNVMMKWSDSEKPYDSWINLVKGLGDVYSALNLEGGKIIQPFHEGE